MHRKRSAFACAAEYKQDKLRSQLLCFGYCYDHILRLFNLPQLPEQRPAQHFVLCTAGYLFGIAAGDNLSIPANSCQLVK